MLPLQATLPDDLVAATGIDLPSARRIVSHVHREGGLPDKAPATIRRVSLDRARALGHVPSLTIAERMASAVDPFVKYALRTGDGESVETVRIPLERAGRFSVCVSSQVGCALACAFCATGRMGLRRNLETWEIVEQVRVVRRELPEGARVHGVVFQGMGEPLANLDRVIYAIRILSEPSALAIDQRNITVCTAGLPAGIRRLARELPSVRLGLSLGDLRIDRRRRLMPIDGTHPIEEVLEAVGEHASASGHSPMWAYTLLSGENDGDDAAHALADAILAFTERHGVRPRLSLIPFNHVDGAGFVRQDAVALARFRDALGSRGVGSILRYSGGGDVGAACGQLAGRDRAARPSRLARGPSDP